MQNDSLLSVAKLGKTIGLHGDLKIHFLSDFPEQFKKGAVFHTQKWGDLEVENFDKNRSLIRFVGFSTLEKSQKLVNSLLLTTKEQTRKRCFLKKDEFFWFDLIGLKVHEEALCLGIVKQIRRIANTDYLQISTNDKLIKQGLAKTFLLPYIDRYILNTSLEEEKIYTKDALSILENS